MITVLHGPAEFDRSEALAALRRSADDDSGIDRVELDGRRLKLDVLVQACEARAFFSTRRLVIVNDALRQMPAGKERDAVRQYLARVPPTCDLVFVEQDTVPANNALLTTIKRIGEIHEFVVPKADGLTNWIVARAQHHRARLARPLAARLLFLVGADQRRLDHELAKLATFVGVDGIIDAPTLDALVHDDHERKIYEFTDAFGERALPQTLGVLHGLLADGQVPIVLVAALARQVRQWALARDAIDRGKRSAEIAAELRLPPFIADKLVRQARGFSDAELAQLHERVTALDQVCKTGRADPAARLVLLIAEFCR
ncbi:MAG: DNA polymerase III subunit delta [Chloroflexi bacterium]|nr:DNA polymerase III subunit delta [Chloroflexota bacterium]